VGAADFNRDGKPDLIWQDESTREVMVWFLGGPQGITVLGSAWIRSTPAPGLRVVASSDFNGDGIPDLVWQDDALRTVTVWFMGGAQGTEMRTWAWLSSTPAPGWTIRGAADFNGDGRPDLIWQNDANCSATVWFLGGADGTTLLSWSWFSTGITNATIVAPR
jgi:hypothetical protein